MNLFKISNTLERIPQEPFRVEKEIQTLTEKNIDKIFNLNIVKTEFSIKEFRLDTLAFDDDSMSFVIIEYKNNKSFSVVDQGFSYLSLMLSHKADFILEYNECMKKSLKRNDVDWTQSKVIFVSPQFTPYQKQAINFKDLQIELWQVKRFSNKTIFYEQVQTQGATASVETILGADKNKRKILKEIKVYNEQDHFQGIDEEMVNLYTTFRDAIINLGDITVKPKKQYLAFIANRNVVDISVQKNKIKMWINLKKGGLEDSKKLTKDVSSTGTWGNGDYELAINSDDDLEYILSLVKQSLKYNAK